MKNGKGIGLPAAGVRLLKVQSLQKKSKNFQHKENRVNGAYKAK